MIVVREWNETEGKRLALAPEHVAVIEEMPGRPELCRVRMAHGTGTLVVAANYESLAQTVARALCGGEMNSKPAKEKAKA